MYARKFMVAAICSLLSTAGLLGCGSTVVASSSGTTPTSTENKLAISAPAAATAVDGASYSLAISASGGKPGYQWSVRAGVLPAGLSLQETSGVITGTPVVSGVSTFEVAAADQSDPVQTASATVSLMVVPRLSIQISTPSQAQVASAYSFQPQLTGGTPAYSWTVSAGTLPQGLTLNPATGAIAGVPAVAGTYGFSITVSDSGTPSQSQTMVYSLYVASQPQPKPQPLSITTKSIPNTIFGDQYSAQFAATGGKPNYTWAVTSGSLPSGLALSSTTGLLSGVTTKNGSFAFTLTTTDQSTPAQTQSLTVSLVVLPRLVFQSSTPAQAQVGTSYLFAPQVTGGTPGYSWKISAGSLPPGLTLNSSTGAIQGSPTLAGTYSFSLTVGDSGTPGQSQSMAYSISVAPQSKSLTIGAASIPNAITGKQYSAQLSASGGSPNYTWKVVSGSLPSGITLSSTTGLLSGVTAQSGSFPFTVSVSDQSTPGQTQSAKITLLSIAKLDLTSTTLSAGTEGDAYTASLSATGGSPSYLWSVASGSLPSGMALNASSGLLSGTPAAGNFSFVISVADQGTPQQEASASFTLKIAANTPPASQGTTWYVRPDGGTRYSANMPHGQCDGKSDQPYSGTGTNQHCAFNDARFLWQDGSYTVTNNSSSFPAYGWIGSGGDTYLIRGSIESGVSWRVGYQNSLIAFDLASNHLWGVQGDPYGSGAPAPPSGTASQHTRILGENYQACHAAGARTQLSGGFGVSAVLNMAGVSYVDVACLDITDHSSCGLASQIFTCIPTLGLMSDYAAMGIRWSRSSTNDTVTDVRIHGMANAGMFGPTGDGITMQYLDLIGNAASGWNADAGDGTTGTGKLLVQNYNISWNGCAEEYPIAHDLPYLDCTDDNVGGYGDGFGTATTPSNPGWQVTFDQGLVTYNTQDGLDALHLTGSGSSMTVTRTEAFGNMGQQIKVGGASGTVLNSLVVTNCNALRQTLPGAPAGFNLRLSDFCRAADTGVLLTVGAHSKLTFAFNTVYSAAATGIGIACDTTNGACDATSQIDFRNNIFFGFPNDSANGYPSGTGDFSNPIYNGTAIDFFANTGSVYSNNLTYHAKSNWRCPALHETEAICGDPQINDESYHLYDAGDMSPKEQSVAIGSGVAIQGVTQDFLGNMRGALPTIGALEH